MERDVSAVQDCNLVRLEKAEQRFGGLVDTTVAEGDCAVGRDDRTVNVEKVDLSGHCVLLVQEG